MSAIRQTAERVVAGTPAPPALSPDRPVLLTPTIVIALDQQGAEVCERLASLVRANIRGPRHNDARAVRERFGFIRLLRDQHAPGLTEVQAIAIDPSERLWNIADATWQYRPFSDQRAVSFATALRQVVSDVLHYTLVEEDLRDRNIMVQPSNLNVFFAGALLHELSSDDLHAALLAPADPDLPSPMSAAVERTLDEIRSIAESVRLYAEESASLDLVVRGAFLSLVLPVDSYAIVRESVQRHGTTLGKLLTPPSAAEYVDLVGYKEPPLHFCSLYTDHDDRGAWYDPPQLTNMIASAIYALMQSELSDNGTCATQLGLRDPYAGPYERIITVAATRSSLPRADLLDYAALQYGAYLLDQLVPDATGSLSRAERDQLRPIVDDLIALNELTSLAERSGDALWDRRGLPCQLSRLASDATYAPPNLQQLIPEPRASWRSAWTEHVQATLHELTRLDGLSGYFDTPFVGEDGIPIALELPDAAGQFTYDQEPLLLEWHRWRLAIEERVDNPDTGEIMRRIAAICHNLDDCFWGTPRGVALSGTRYSAVLLDLLNERMRDVQRLINRQQLPSPPNAAQIEAELEHARRRGLIRVSMSALVALSLLFVPLLMYLFLAIRDSPADDRFAALLRRAPLVQQLPSSDRAISIPVPLLIAVIASLGLLAIGLIIRQFQTVRAISGMRGYAQLIRQKYSLLMYGDEQRWLDSIPTQILTYRQFLQRYTQAVQAAGSSAAMTLRERATAISDRGFSDVSEYLPAARGGPQAIYQQLIKPRMAEHAESDLPRLQREAREICSFVEAPVQTDGMLIEQAARAALYTIVLGDPSVSEQDPLARLRFLAYQSLQADLEDVVRQTVTQLTMRRAQDLQQRTHLMLRTGYRPDMYAFEQSYLVAAIQGIDEKPALAETTTVRGLDQETVMYVRIANGVWPRLFEGAGVQLQ